MRLVGTVQIAISSMGSHPFRAILAGLGVVFGVGAVIAMMAISEGARRESLRQIDVLGVDKIIVRSIKPLSAESGSRVKIYGITEADLVHLRDHFDNVVGVAPLMNMRVPIYNGTLQTTVNVFGSSPDLLALTQSRILPDEGRFLVPDDERDVRSVCVIGKDVAQEFFAHGERVGRKMHIRGVVFEIVGVLESPFSYTLEGGYPLNNQIFIPLTTARALFGTMSFGQDFSFTQVDYDYLYVTVADVDTIINTSQRMRTYFTTAHSERDVDVHVPYELLKQKEATQRIFTIVMGSIAAISLLVGGIGIMNIMLANVYERMREIGTRRALGATQYDILGQFLLESMALTSVGGVIGVIVGSGLALVVEIKAGMPTAVTAYSIAISLCVSVFTGIVFGTFPAWKAASLNPIAALRHE